MGLGSLFTKQDLIESIATYRVENTPHKDYEKHVEALKKLSKRELWMIDRRIMQKEMAAGWTPYQ